MRADERRDGVVFHLRACAQIDHGKRGAVAARVIRHIRESLIRPDRDLVRIDADRHRGDDLHRTRIDQDHRGAATVRDRQNICTERRGENETSEEEEQRRDQTSVPVARMDRPYEVLEPVRRTVEIASEVRYSALCSVFPG